MKSLKRLEGKRWFIWALVVVIIGLGGLAAYIYVSSVNESTGAVPTMVEHQDGQGKLGAGSGVPNTTSANTQSGSSGTVAPTLTAQEMAELKVPLHRSSTVGNVGTLTVTGYLSIKYEYCYENGAITKLECGPERAFFEFMKSDSPLLYSMVREKGSGDGTLGMGTDEFELGCYQKDSARISAGNIDAYGGDMNDITGADLQAILKTNTGNQATLKLQATPWVGDGKSEPSCWSDFKVLGVTTTSR